MRVNSKERLRANCEERVRANCEERVRELQSGWCEKMERERKEERGDRKRRRGRIVRGGGENS